MISITRTSSTYSITSHPISSKISGFIPHFVQKLKYSRNCHRQWIGTMTAKRKVDDEFASPGTEMMSNGKNDADVNTRKMKRVTSGDDENNKKKKIGNGVSEKSKEPLPVFNASMRKPKYKDAAFRVITWNVAGMRALQRKDQLQSIVKLVEEEDPDIICLQEHKLQEGQHCTDMQASLDKILPGWKAYWSCSKEKKGYSGVAMICKPNRLPIKVWEGIDMEEHDGEGRVLTAEYDKHFVVNVYVPNSGAGLKRLDYRVGENGWDAHFSSYVKKLEYEKGKHVVITGDMNCAVEEIDIHSPKTNLRSAGFTIEERESFTKSYLANGFTDAFRKLYPGVIGYTYWGYRGPNLRGQNKGWRLDYFLVSEKLFDQVHDCWHHPEIMGSDHCPLGITVIQ